MIPALVEKLFEAEYGFMRGRINRVAEDFSIPEMLGKSRTQTELPKLDQLHAAMR